MLVLSSIALGEQTAERVAFFEKKIRPVLIERCYQCHSPESKNIKGGLLLHSRAASRRGGETGPAVVPGDVDSSLLIAAIRYESMEMPPDGKLPHSVIADFERWIKLGAVDPRIDEANAPVVHEINFESARQFWSFQRPAKHTVPDVRDPSFSHRRADRFVACRLEEAGLRPSDVADRRALIRRVTFDLIGLPPTPEEVAKFVRDPRPGAYEHVVDRLLASPHYGEHWARMWLDIARYAEDQAHIVGNDQALFYPNAHLFREWVISAFNDDLSYDDFIKQQLAADFLFPEDKVRHVALGFIGLGPKYYRRNDPRVMADEWEDRVDVVSRGLLGLTVACARCHDHKFDPIETEDYYALAGVFASTKMVNRPNESVAKDSKAAKDPKNAIHIVEDGAVKDLKVFIRGDVNSKGPVVPRRFLRVLSSSEPAKFHNGSGRLELAEAIANRNNPLTARVIVNRIWTLHFGRPLVGTPSNFGSLGQLPTHPQLLDDLAVRFMESGWSLKWLQREIVTSATYQQSSQPPMDQLSADPNNQWLGRMTRRRLSIESWRDTMLSATGRLSESIGGTSIDPQEPDERRRTIYSRISRFELNPMLVMFDFPDPNAHSAHRSETTTALQKLFIMNNAFMVKQAEALVERLGDDEDEFKIRRAYQILYARPATQDEIDLGLAFLQQDAADAWRQYAQALLAANEMLFLD